LRSRDAKSILVYGWIGIGKTAFVREVLEGLQRNMGKDVLTASIKLEAGTDLATAALIALAREMPNDEWAQFQLNRMGLRPDMALRRPYNEGRGQPGVARYGRRIYRQPQKRPVPQPEL
jgi:Cdc6-like AAA superfamily ATPase